MNWVDLKLGGGGSNYFISCIMGLYCCCAFIDLIK
jgi:hypothetical protein